MACWRTFQQNSKVWDPDFIIRKRGGLVDKRLWPKKFFSCLLYFLIFELAWDGVVRS